MPQFYLRPDLLTEGRFKLDESESHHAAHVFRLKRNDELLLFDGKGNSYKAVLENINEGIVEGRIVSSKYKSLSFETVLFAPLIKNERFDWLLEKAVELGVNKIVPFISTRSEVKAFKPNERRQRIILSAAKQSMAERLAELAASPVKFMDAIKIKQGDTSNMLFSAREGAKKISEILISPSIKTYTFWIGPEGGFTDNEINAAVKEGFHICSLGGEVLRSETACIAALAVFKNQMATTVCCRKQGGGGAWRQGVYR